MENQYEEKIVQINRVSKKTKGGNKMRFSALAVVGDRKGKVGVGLGKSADVSTAIQKAIAYAKKHFIDVPIENGTIPRSIRVKEGAAEVLLKPAPQGSGIIAGGAVRSVVEAAGIHNISSKILGTGNKGSNVHATFAALRALGGKK
jgi:small subunit ribosomal protein S5